jgi:hypothetical protein
MIQACAQFEYLQQTGHGVPFETLEMALDCGLKPEIFQSG